MKNGTRYRGFLWAEMVIATALLGVVMAGLAASLNGFSLVNRYQWARQRCVAAAQAQLDSLAATGRPIAAPELNRLWPDVEVVVHRSRGAGAWEGLERVQVTATARPGPHPVTIRLTRYLGVGTMESWKRGTGEWNSGRLEYGNIGWGHAPATHDSHLPVFQSSRGVGGQS